MDPADLSDDDPGVTSWAGVSDAVAEMRAALAAAEDRAERAETRLSDIRALAGSRASPDTVLNWIRVALGEP